MSDGPFLDDGKVIPIANTLCTQLPPLLVPLLLAQLTETSNSQTLQVHGL